MQYHRKEYEFEYEFHKKILRFWKKKKILIKYKQASMKELNEFLYQLNGKDHKQKKSVYQRIRDFIKKNSNVKESDMEYVMLGVDTVFNTIKDTYFYGCFAKEEERQKKKQDAPEQSFIVMLAEKFSLDPDSLMEKYTPEMIKYYTEGLVWNVNEQSKEGKAKNRINARKRHMDNMSKDERSELDRKLAMIK